jgi:hypothetical protein
MIVNNLHPIYHPSVTSTRKQPLANQIHKNPPLPPLTALRTAHLAIEKWIQPLGPVSGWAQKFHEGYNIACQAGGNMQEDIDKFLGTVQEHVNIGRGILGKLGESPIICPQPSMDAWADWLIAGDMLGTFYQGIAILEAHLDILALRCPIPSDSTSKTRQWVGLDGLI